MVRPAKGAMRPSGVTAKTIVSSTAAVTTNSITPHQNQLLRYHGDWCIVPARLKQSMPTEDATVPIIIRPIPRPHHGCGSVLSDAPATSSLHDRRLGTSLASRCSQCGVCSSQ